MVVANQRLETRHAAQSGVAVVSQSDRISSWVSH
jgi:hypothetical protein